MSEGFRFGVATADHQCEAYDGHDDIRDVWERVRGLTPRGRATDFWNRYREDVDLAKGLGCTAFRLSLAWARLEPDAGAWSEDAFAHYRDVLQYVRDAGMATIVTLHHNTWPLHVQAAGNGAGMLDAGFPDRMEAYATQVARRLGDLVDYYVALNEPNQLVYGFIKGFWMRAYAMPPGLEPLATGKEQMEAVLRLIPNLFLAHARSRAAIQREHPGSKVGANPLILGLPRWLQNIADYNATHLTPASAKRQAERLSQHRLIDKGLVDVTIAQLTMTQSRMNDVLFSEPYLVAHYALLHAGEAPTDFMRYRGRVGVTAASPTSAAGGGIFPAAALVRFDGAAEAAAALRAGDIDAVFDDDALLKPYAVDGLTMTRVEGPDQPFAVAMALGSRTLLNVVDEAIRDWKDDDPDVPRTHNRKTVAHIGKTDRPVQPREKSDVDASVRAIRKRGVLRVGVRPGVAGLCVRDASGAYEGREPEIARAIARRIFGDETNVRYVELHGDGRVRATRSPLKIFDDLRKTIALFTTLLGANWWNLGMAGRLPEFLCPRECVGALDYVGLDYYWGVPSLRPSQLQRLAAASECRYANAPVWPGFLDDILTEAHRAFPDKPIVVIENGCVHNADGFSRAAYVEAHVGVVEKALQRGLPIEAYICWSITSNREWGLPFDGNSDFGLYHIDLDTDPDLKRVPTPASEGYAAIIAAPGR